MADRKITMGAATQIGNLEYQLFTDWYKKTYGKDPPKNDAAITINPYYIWWETNLRSNVWSPSAETASTVESFKQSGTPTNVPYNPPPQYEGDIATTPNMPEVVSQGGYDWYPIKDPATGEIVTWELIGKTPSGQDDWSKSFQERQFAYQQEQDRMAQERARLGAEMEQAGAARQQMVNAMSGRTEGDIQRQRAQMWDEIRASVMSSIKDIPSEWLNYKQLEIAQNPFAQTQTAGDWLSVAQERTAKAKELLKEAKSREKIAASDPDISLTAADKEFIEFAKGEYQAATDISGELEKGFNTGYQLREQGHDISEIWSEYGRAPTEAELEGWMAAPRATGGGNFAVGVETVPQPVKGVATPDWMGRYASQLKGKQWIPGTGNVGGSLTEVNPLSGQAAQRLSPTQLEMMKGLVKFSGQEPSDWLYQASVQTPRNISLGRTWR